MDTAILIWLYLSVGKLVNLMEVPAVVSVGVFSIAGLLRIAASADEELAPLKGSLSKAIKMSASFALVFMLLYSLYPTKSDLAWIIGGSSAVAISQHAEAKKLPDNVLKAMNVFLEDVQERANAE